MHKGHIPSSSLSQMGARDCPNTTGQKLEQLISSWCNLEMGSIASEHDALKILDVVRMGSLSVPFFSFLAAHAAVTRIGKEQAH